MRSVLILTLLALSAFAMDGKLIEDDVHWASSGLKGFNLGF
jgi:hypothetical protein